MKNKNYLKKLSLALVLLVGFTNFVNAQIPSYVPTNGLVGYWPFNGNANDVSSNANNGTNNGATLTTDRFGNANSAYSFNGTSNYISTANSSTSFVNGITISAWVKLAGTTGTHQFFVSKGYDSNTGAAFLGYRNFLSTENEYFGKVQQLGSQSEVYSGTPLTFPMANWQQVIMVFNNQTIYLYVDGVLKSTKTFTTPLSTLNKPFIFGCETSSDYLSHVYFAKGIIDDIGIWNRALTIDEITNLYNANLCYQSSFIINTGLLSYNPPTYNNTITIYPNPANDHITIDCGTIANVVGYHIEIATSLGQVVFNQPMNTQQYTVALNTWSGQGIYFVKVYDASNTLLTTRKLILQ